MGRRRVNQSLPTHSSSLAHGAETSQPELANSFEFPCSFNFCRSPCIVRIMMCSFNFSRSPCIVQINAHGLSTDLGIGFLLCILIQMPFGAIWPECHVML